MALQLHKSVSDTYTHTKDTDFPTHTHTQTVGCGEKKEPHVWLLQGFSHSYRSQQQKGRSYTVPYIDGVILQYVL